MIRLHRRPTEAVMAARLDRLRRVLGEVDKAHLPAWLRPTRTERRWAVGVAILVSVGIQFRLNHDLVFRPWWLLPAIELILFAVLSVANPMRIDRESILLRWVALTLVTVASLSTAWSAALLVVRVLSHRMTDAGGLLLNGGAIWLTNVIVFALWYWEGDRGGPGARANATLDYPDFLFPQMTAPELVPKDWEPTFVDYFYLSFTNATAFSPTDTLPLSRWAKLTMLAESAVSLVTVALIVARAVNILR